MPVFVGQKPVPEYDPPPPPAVFPPLKWVGKYRPKIKPKYEYMSVRPYFQNLHDPETRQGMARKGYYACATEFTPYAAVKSQKGHTYKGIQTEDPRTIILREAYDAANEQAFDDGYWVSIDETRVLNHFSEQGWELVSVTEGVCHRQDDSATAKGIYPKFYFKRELELIEDDEEPEEESFERAPLSSDA